MDRFAVWLLHKHFVPEPGEVFVERAIPTPPQTHTTLIDRGAFSESGLHATAVRFDTAVIAGVGLVGMEFAGPADFGPITSIGPEDEAVLAGFAERLRARGKIDRFGVRLIRNQLGISDDQELMETCNKPRRALHCAVIETADRPAENSVETTWRIKPVAVGSGPPQRHFPRERSLPLENWPNFRVVRNVRRQGSVRSQTNSVAST